MTTKAIYAICLAGATASLAIGFGSGVWSLVSAQDGWIFPLVIGPYALVALVARWRRDGSWESFLLLVAALLISVGGIAAVSSSAYRFHSSPRNRTAMDITAIVAPLAQWILAASVAAMLGLVAIVRMAAAKKSPADRTDSG